MPVWLNFIPDASGDVLYICTPYEMLAVETKACKLLAREKVYPSDRRILGRVPRY